MGVEQYYEIPNKTNIRAALVDAIPSDWEYVNGKLIVPPGHLVNYSRAVENTGYLISKYGANNPIIVGAWDCSIPGHPYRSKPDLFSIQ